MKNKYLLWRAGSITCFLLIWQGYGMLNKVRKFVNPNFLPAPTDILQTAVVYLQKGIFFSNIYISFQRILIGFFIGTLLAVVLGYFIAKSPIFENIVDPIISAVGSIPAYAFMPLFIIWFGVGENAKITLIVYATFLPLLTYTVQGIKSIDPLHIRSAMSLGANGWQIFCRVVIKTALPFIVTGMKVSLGLSFSALVVAEMMGADKGLGYIIVDARNWFKVADMFLAITLIGTMYIIMLSFLSWVEKKLFKWKNTGFSNAVE